MESKLNAIFEDAVQAKVLPGVAAVVLDKSGKVLYKNAFGTTNLDDPAAAPYTASTPTQMFSCTKLVTCVAALQLIEQGKLHTDDPVENWLPELKNLKVMDGIDSNGKFKYRAPRTKPTILHLLTHTAGFGYDLFNKDIAAWWSQQKVTATEMHDSGKIGYFQTPLLSDPGTCFHYGVNTDWLGFVIEAVSGLGLDEYIQKHVTTPLGMLSTTASPVQDRIFVHLKGMDGKLTCVKAIAPPEKPERRSGGAYLFSTLDDYSTLLLTLLNNGTHPQTGAKVLQPETVQNYLLKDLLPKIGCSNQGLGEWDTASPDLTRPGRMLPHTNLGFSCGLLLNLEDMPNGRKQGSGAWAGFSNNYYWIDPAAGKVGLMLSAILPFMDPPCLALFDALERTAYGHEIATTPGEKGSNFEAY